MAKIILLIVFPLRERDTNIWWPDAASAAVVVAVVAAVVVAAAPFYSNFLLLLSSRSSCFSLILGSKRNGQLYHLAEGL